MTNLLAAIIHVILISSVALTLFFAYLRDRTKLITKHLFRLGFLAIGWQIFLVLYFLVDSEAMALWFFDAKISFIAFASVQSLLLSINFYNVAPSHKSTPALYLLFLMPVITTILAVTSPFHSLLRVEPFFEQFTPLRVVHNVRGLWFWVHTAYSYIIIVSSIVIVIFKHSKLPRGYRKASAFLVLGGLCSLISNVFVLFTPNSPNIDFTLIGFSVGIIFTYAGITSSDEGSLLVQAHDNIFTYFEDYIFVLNNEYRIIEMNPAAHGWLYTLGVKENIESFDELCEKIPFITDTAIHADVAGEQDLSLMIGPQTSHYNLNKRPVIDQTGRMIGTFAIFRDITRYKLLIERIEQSADIDPLTNIGNRRSYEQALKNLDVPASLPFSVILGDVNNLKTTNDTLGHSAGDKLLQAIAKKLSISCPDGMRVYRIGGDEFVMLLPNTPAANAETIVASIRKNIAKNKEELPYDISIALGIATKETHDQNLLERIALADRNMYLDKQNDRRARRGQAT